MDDKEKGYPVTPCMDFCKENIQSDEGLEKCKLKIIARGDLKNNEIIGYTWDTTSSISTLKY